MAQSDANLSQDSNETQPNLSKGLGEMQISAQNVGQALDILSAEAENFNDVQQQETALANVNLLRNLMRQTGVTPMMTSQERPAGLTSMATSYSRGSGVGDAADRAMDVASRVQDLGFVEFTTGLINGTFDAIIGATIKQMEAYAALVADLAKTLSQFQAENVSDAEINAYLSDRYPEVKGGTSIRTDYTFKPTEADTVNGIVAKTANENFQSVVDALVLETSGLELGNRLIRIPVTATVPPALVTDSSLAIPVADGTSIKFNSDQVAKIRKAIGILLASSMMSNLRAMAREGMARIVVTEGSIRTKLTFQVSSTEIQQKQQASYRRNSLDVNVKANARWGWGSASIGAGYSNLNVRTANETSTASITMSTEMIGEVNIKFRTETFTPYEPPIVKVEAPIVKATP